MPQNHSKFIVLNRYRIYFFLFEICYFLLVFNTIFAAEAGTVLNLFLNFEQKKGSCSYKIVLIKKCRGGESPQLSCQFIWEDLRL